MLVNANKIKKGGGRLGKRGIFCANSSNRREGGTPNAKRLGGGLGFDQDKNDYQVGLCQEETSHPGDEPGNQVTRMKPGRITWEIYQVKIFLKIT